MKVYRIAVKVSVLAMNQSVTAVSDAAAAMHAPAHGARPVLSCPLDDCSIPGHI